MRKIVGKDLHYILFIIIYSLLLCIYTNFEIDKYKIIKYYMSERTFYIIITILVISVNAYILIKIVAQYFQISKMLITRIGKVKFNLFLVERLICYISIIFITNLFIDFILFGLIDILAVFSSVLISVIVIPFLKNDNFNQYNYVICIVLMFILQILISKIA